MRPSALVLAWALLAAAVGCGSDSDPAPPPEDAAGPPSGDTGAGDPPGTGGGDPADAPSDGGGGGTPPGDAIPPGGGGTPGGGEKPPAPSGPVSSGDGTVKIDRLDESAECDFVPTRAPDAVAAALQPTGAPGSCMPGGSGISEGGGHVAVTVDTGAGWRAWQVFTSDGREEERFNVPRLFPQPDGWAAGDGGARTSPFPSVQAIFFFPGGSTRSTTTLAAPGDADIHEWSVHEDPLGGLLLLFSWHSTDGSRTCVGEAHRFDAVGGARGASAGMGCYHLAAGVSRLGEAIVLERRIGEPSELWVHWVRADGSAARPPSREGLVGEVLEGSTVSLAPLLDGSIAVNEGGRWTRRYPHLAGTSEPAPGWLAALPRNTAFRNTRGNRGYVFFPPDESTGGESADCARSLELRAPSGRLCGKVTLREPGGPCALGEVDQGWDGTVVQRSGACAWRWWPGLLAR